MQQVYDANSQHRMDRAAALPPPKSAADVLAVLGDTTDNDPAPKATIYQMGPDLYTLATALFDVNACNVTVMTGNPKTAPVVEAVWTLDSSVCTAV